MLKRARYVVAIFVVAITVAVLLVAPCLLQAQQPQISPDAYGQLKYRYIGPEGNRATSVAGVPGKPTVRWRWRRAIRTSYGRELVNLSSAATSP